MTFPRQRVAVFFAVLATLIGVACGTGQVIDPATGEQVWSVMPRSAILRAINATLQLDVVNGQGHPVAIPGLSRRILDPGIVQLDATGRVTAAAPGVARIVVETSTRADTATIEVRQDVAAVAVSPATSSIVAGSTQQLASTLRDPNGFPVTNRVVTWASSALSVATVSSGGLVATHAPGSATITATSEGRSGTAALTVTPVPAVPVATVEVSPTSATLQVGQTQQLSVIVRDAGGAVLTGRAVSWTTNDGATATVSGSGLVTAAGPGTATITATSEGRSGTASVTVTSASVPVASVSVSPASLSLTVGQTGQLTATPRDAAGNALSGRTIAWTTTAGAVATVSGSGLVTAMGPGSATITATSEGRSASATVAVTSAPPAPVASVSVSPNSLSLSAGQTGQLSATLRDAAGTVLTGRAVTWTTTASGVATVNGTGLVTAQGVGTATITATSEGRSGTAGVTVTTGTPVPTLFLDNFESGALNDAGRWHDIVGSFASIVTASAEGIPAASGTRVLRLGATGGAMTHFVATGSTSPYEQLYLSYQLYRPSAYRTSNRQVRAGGIRGSTTQWGSFGVGYGTAGSCPDDPNNRNRQEFMFAYHFLESGAWALRTYTNWLGARKLTESPPTCGGGYAMTAGNNPQATYHEMNFVPTPDAWHHYEIEVRLNDVGQSNGWQRIWVDGVLKIEHLNVMYRTTPNMKLWAITFDTGSPLVDAFYVDDVVVKPRRTP